MPPLHLFSTFQQHQYPTDHQDLVPITMLEYSKGRSEFAMQETICPSIYQDKSDQVCPHLDDKFLSKSGLLVEPWDSLTGGIARVGIRPFHRVSRVDLRLRRRSIVNCLRRAWPISQRRVRRVIAVPPWQSAVEAETQATPSSRSLGEQA